jgi:hypothetical protein
MSTLEQIDRNKVLQFEPYQHDGNYIPVENLDTIIIEGDNVGLFLDWVSGETWRPVLEQELYSMFEDDQGPLLTTWLPLVTFRNSLCGGGRNMQNTATQKLMDYIVESTRGWRDAGCDEVYISGYLIIKKRIPVRRNS